ncbi:ropporin-1-like protein, partial [Carlito syrichta]|uniref:Ropporin-1-like protein n=1 Tax=Carlito syrichta TaxID=1868482 RepID=A0A1U7TQY1_CARSF
MPLPDTMFCAQQIPIPPELLDILKQFTKAVIRTQPTDVLRWSAGYFSALSRGEPLPVKDRLELPVATQKTDTGLTQGFLKVLHKQCNHMQYVELADLKHKWKNLCLPVEKFKALLELDPHENTIEWIKFLALGCSMLSGSLNTAMKHLCEILTADSEGGA